MNSKTVSLALIALAALTMPATLAAAPDVDGKSFDQQARSIDDGVKATADSGVFGRPGPAGDQAPRSSSVGDREMDRYVQRLGMEIRLRNSMADRDETGFR